jgi:GTP-binding protein
VFKREDVRNIAIIAHVDHGKTTLVDGMLKQSGIFRANEQVQERIMDSNDLEKERGITILSKNTSVIYKDFEINIVDTPGHADFGGEVERVLNMVDGVLLLVDAFEGCMPQTRFVLTKALQLGLKPIVVVNKIDRPTARVEEVIDEVLELFIELGADDEQLEFPVVYASALDSYAVLSPDETGDNLIPLFETIISQVPPPEGDPDGALQVLVSSIDYNDYVGRIAIGRIERGTLKNGQQAILFKKDGTQNNIKIGEVYKFKGLGRKEVENAKAGDIVAVSGIVDINIGDTICDIDNPEPLPSIKVDEPTISVNFSVNNSPFAGREGTFVTSRQIRERLFKETENNVSLRVEETSSTDSFKVSGRGELHLSILIETMRRQGYEFQVSRPEVIYRTVDGQRNEPIELLSVDIQEECMGVVIEKLSSRKAEMQNMVSNSSGYVKIDFKIPARGLIGYRSEFMTDTKGNGILNHIFSGYEQYKGDIPVRQRGSLVAFETGEATSYGLFNAQERGRLFVTPGEKVYEGMVVGENSRTDDIAVNVCKKKHVTNMRASGSDEALKLTPAIKFSLEQSIEFIGDDELVEITPKSIRIRKRILNNSQRQKMKKD